MLNTCTKHANKYIFYFTKLSNLWR